MQIAIPAGGETRARKFYGTVLGLSEIDKPEALRGRSGVWFEADGFQVHLGVLEPFVPSIKAHPGFLASNLDDLANRLEVIGAVLSWDTNIPGKRRFYVHDPFGNRLEFLGSG